MCKRPSFLALVYCDGDCKNILQNNARRDTNREELKRNRETYRLDGHKIVFIIKHVDIYQIQRSVKGERKS